MKILSYFVYRFVKSIRSFLILSSNKISTAYYKTVCLEFGSGSSVGWGTWINRPELVSIGEDVIIGRNVVISSETASSNLIIRNGSHVNNHVSIDFSGGVFIGENVMLSDYSRISSHSHGRDPFGESVYLSKSIGNNVWVGERALIMANCRLIKDGAIVGAGCNVANDVDSSIVVSAKNRVIV